MSSTRSDCPDLAEYGLIGPGNCSGSSLQGRGDQRYGSVSDDQGANGLPRPFSYNHYTQTLTYKGRTAVRPQDFVSRGGEREVNAYRRDLARRRP